MSRAVRILYVDTAQSVGGSVISLYHLVRRLDRQRFEPVLLSYSDHAYVPRFRELGVEVIIRAATLPAGTAAPHWSDTVRHTGPVRLLTRNRLTTWLYHLAGFWVKRLPRLVKEAWAIRRIIREERIDLVHCNVRVGTDRAAILGAALAGVPCISHVRDYDHLHLLDQLVARLVTRYIYISQAVARRHWAQGVSTRKGHVVYNGVDPDQFRRRSDQATIRRQLGLSEKDRVVGVVGRLEAWKGQHVFLQALADAASQIPDCQGLVVGEAEPYSMDYRDYLVSMVEDLNLGHRVHFLGFRADIPELLSVLDVLVSPSAVGEPFGRTIVEGMAAGIPVIATAAGAVPEIVEDGVTGLLVPPQDAKSLSRAIVSLLTNGSDVEQMGQMARQRVAERFTAQQTAASVQAIYEELL